MGDHWGSPRADYIFILLTSFSHIPSTTPPVHFLLPHTFNHHHHHHHHHQSTLLLLLPNTITYVPRTTIQYNTIQQLHRFSFMHGLSCHYSTPFTQVQSWDLTTFYASSPSQFMLHKKHTTHTKHTPFHIHSTNLAGPIPFFWRHWYNPFTQTSSLSSPTHITTNHEDN